MNTASLARVYDAQIGGGHNFAVDRQLAEDIDLAMPGASQASVANRMFLGRAVRWCAAEGIDQFLDVGSGIPTAGNVHEVAQSVNPDARTVYVDIDAVAVTMSHELLGDDPHSTVVQGDLRDPVATILDAPETRRLIDFDRPVAFMLLFILHAIPDGDAPTQLISKLTGRAVPGSTLAVSHFARGICSETVTAAVEQLSNRSSTPVVARDAEQLREFMGRFEPVTPGIVAVDHWRPEPWASATAPTAMALGAVGRLARPAQ